MTDILYTYEEDGEIHDFEFDEQQQAYDYAFEAFAEECEENGIGADEREITIIEFYFDDDGERKILKRTKELLEFEYYHGDRAEHGTLHSGGGGVL